MNVTHGKHYLAFLPLACTSPQQQSVVIDNACGIFTTPPMSNPSQTPPQREPGYSDKEWAAELRNRARADKAALAMQEKSRREQPVNQPKASPPPPPKHAKAEDDGDDGMSELSPAWSARVEGSRTRRSPTAPPQETVHAP